MSQGTISMNETVKAIEEIINRETTAWNTKDVELLLSIFHPDMVWPWPRTNQAHDPMDWVFTQGKFDYARWKSIYQDFFDRNELANNRREIKRIEISKEEDGAFAVVDIDTIWKSTSGEISQWKGRACKIYAKVRNEWKMIMQTGLLEY